MLLLDLFGKKLQESKEEYSQKVRDLQRWLSETTELHEQQKISLKQTISDLQTKLLEVQLERDTLEDMRQRESHSQESIKMQLKTTIQELETANCLQEEMLREADSQTEHLKKVVHDHEEVLMELRGILMDYKDSTGKKALQEQEQENIASLQIHNLSAAFTEVLRDLDSEVVYLKEKIVQVEEELESLKKDSQTKTDLLLQQHQNRIEQLVSEHEQEVAALTEKANSARSHANSIQSQMEIIQEQTRSQNSMHEHQASQLESTVSQLRSELREAKRMYEHKVEDLEKQLHLARSEMAEAQTERDQYSQESGNLDDQLHQLLTELHKKEIELSLEKEQNKRFWDRDRDNSITIDHLRRELETKNMELKHVENTVKAMRMECQEQTECQVAAIKEKNESIERISSLTVQLDSTKEMLRKVREDLKAKQVNLEAAERTVSTLTACLQEKERAVDVTNKEIKKLRAQVDSRMQELQHLKNEGDRLHSVQSECDTLRLQVVEKERIIGIFQKQIDNMTQMVGQHSRVAGAMEVEKSQLMKEITDWKLEVQELKIVKEEKEARILELEARLSELELEKVKLVNTCTERLHTVKDMKLEKDQLMKELKASRSELAGLTEEYEDLKKNFRGKTEEMENNAKKLKMQLKSAKAELDQTRAALKTMEGSDGHAMKVAMGMQKQITAKRGQIDALQSKIKFLEEAMTNAAKEKNYLKEENNKLSQELSYIATENTKMTGELEILRSQDKRLKEKISKMETALDKASMQFSECQCIIQCQEQEAMRFRLQHALDVKELQGLGYSSAPAPGRQRPVLPLPQQHAASGPPRLPPASGVPHMPPKLSILKEEPLRDLKKILQELSSDSEIPSVALSKNDSDGARTSPVATVRNTVDPLPLHIADLQSQDVSLPFTSTIASQPVETSDNTSRKLQNKMESLQNLVETLQMKNQAMSSMIRTQERKIEKVKEKEKKIAK
ncbi:PREDICTED: coiled-coil domain-containing protein 158 [Tinamus guttatus]|uniref:coiled-coil domain-containing protein 158 n=1 Tax=Tinamus guttatus TaxID=94827 RepID=UPI00052EF687|nr:PREDICTED: coiled-coil domain-containing protein 158 [Tinamus guttatus]